MERQVKDREDFFFGQEEGPHCFFAQPIQISLCGLCVDGEDVPVFGSPPFERQSSGEAACFCQDRVSFGNKQWLSHMIEYLPTATKKLHLPGSSHGPPKLQAAIFQRAGEAVSLPLPEGDTFLRLLVQLPSKCTNGAITVSANGEDHLLPFCNDQAMFYCGLALFYSEMEVRFEELISGERTLLVFDLDWMFMNGSPIPKLQRPNRAPELAEIFEKWESSNPVFVLPRPDSHNVTQFYRPGCEDFGKNDAARIERLIECNQYLSQGAKIRVFIGRIERLSEIPKQIACADERTIIGFTVLQWYAMDGGSCFDPLELPLAVEMGPHLSQLWFSKGKEEKLKSKSVNLHRSYATAIFVLRE